MFYAELAELRGTFFILRQNTTRALASLAQAEHHGINSCHIGLFPRGSVSASEASTRAVL